MNVYSIIKLIIILFVIYGITSCYTHILNSHKYGKTRKSYIEIHNLINNPGSKFKRNKITSKEAKKTIEEVSTNGFLDAWGNPIYISVNIRQQGTALEVLISSGGPDGILGSKDDSQYSISYTQP